MFSVKSNCSCAQLLGGASAASYLLVLGKLFKPCVVVIVRQLILCHYRRSQQIRLLCHKTWFKKKVVLFIFSHKFSELLMVSVNRACAKSDAGGGLRIDV